MEEQIHIFGRFSKNLAYNDCINDVILVLVIYAHDHTQYMLVACVSPMRWICMSVS